MSPLTPHSAVMMSPSQPRFDEHSVHESDGTAVYWRELSGAEKQSMYNVWGSAQEVSASERLTEDCILRMDQS